MDHKARRRHQLHEVHSRQRGGSPDVRWYSGGRYRPATRGISSLRAMSIYTHGTTRRQIILRIVIRANRFARQRTRV